MSRERRRAPEERRKATRIPAVFAVIRQGKGGRVQLCQAEDIGPSGITIRRPKGTVDPPATEISLAFALPGSREEISARGLVVSDGLVGHFRRTGVRFVALQPEHAQLIAGYCRRAPSR